MNCLEMGSLVVLVGMTTAALGGDSIPPASLAMPDAPVSQAWLHPADHPRVVTTREHVDHLRQAVEQGRWQADYIERYLRVVEPVMNLSDDQLRALVPPPGSLFVMGLGNNLDPVRRRRLQWAGWEHPHQVRDTQGTLYPNADWPDDGQGVADPDSGETYYFVAVANARLVNQWEHFVLPALADLWILTGQRDYAHRAAVLLDAIAALYPTNRRGPMDYPTSTGDMDRGGRLHRPYYQVARALMNFVHTVDLVAASEVLEMPSAYGKQTIREHLVRNLLWEGAAYCYDFAAQGYALHNGQVDYARGAAYVGLLLNEPRLADPLLTGPARFEVMLRNNIDPEGYYYETSPIYARHTRDLYISVAEMTRVMAQLGWPKVQDYYQHPSMQRFLTDPFNTQEVGGHVPLIGDSGPDRSVVDPRRRVPGKPRTYMDNLLDDQIHTAWVRLVRGVDVANAAALLRASYGEKPVAVPRTRWALYNFTDRHLALVRDVAYDPAGLETSSVFYGGKGLALLRGGQAEHRHGAQLFFGPIHNHGQAESLTWTFFARGAEWSFDPGHYNRHFRMGWTSSTISHHAMVVDQQRVSLRQGSGQLLAWHDGEQVQWAMAEHPAAYREQGVTRYQRLIAQAQQQAGGELAYWLDIGIVTGGQVRDDSFHTQMQAVTLDVPLPEPAVEAMAGDVDFGRRINMDLTLQGHEDKGFYWRLPGEGYGFLGRPRHVAMSPGRTIRGVFSQAAFWHADQPCPVMVVDFAGQAGRELIVADGPAVANHPSVPYVIQRDRGQGTSVYAKLLRLTDDVALDPIVSFESVASCQAADGAWRIVWQDGRQDLWIVRDPQAHEASAVVQADGLPKVQTDGRVTCVRFNAQGQPIQVTASQAARVAIAGGPVVTGTAQWQGQVAAVDWPAAAATLRLRSEPSDDLSDVAAPGELLRTIGQADSTGSWVIDHVQADRVVLRAAAPVVGSTRLWPMTDQPGWYELTESVSRFISAGGRPNHGYAVGRPVFIDQQHVGNVTELADDARAVRVHWLIDAPESAVDVTLGMIGPGDGVVIPGTLNWSVAP